MTSLVLPPQRASSLAPHAHLAGLWLDLQSRPPPCPAPTTPRSSVGSTDGSNSAVSESSTLVGEEEQLGDKVKSGNVATASEVSAVAIVPERTPTKPSGFTQQGERKKFRPLPILPARSSSLKNYSSSKPRALPVIPHSAPLPHSKKSMIGSQSEKPLPALPTESASVPSTPNAVSIVFGDSCRETNQLRPHSAGISSDSAGSQPPQQGKTSKECSAVHDYAAAEIAKELALLHRNGRPESRPEQPRPRPQPTPPRSPLSTHSTVPDSQEIGDDDELDDDLEDLEDFSVEVVRGVAYRTADIRRVSRIWHGRWVLEEGGEQWDSTDYSAVMNALRNL